MRPFAWSVYKETGVQERLESSRAGRAAISVFIVVTVVCVVVWNLPQSQLKSQAVEITGPFIRATGLNQNWGVFSPDPRRHTLELIARVRYADGTEETLSIPRGGRLVGGYWDYRWRKWAEWTSSDEYDELWQPAADWFARRAAVQGRQPVSVTLARRWRELLPPGPGPSRGEWQEYSFYTYDVPREGAEAR
jgi:hypothetical protein